MKWPSARVVVVSLLAAVSAYAGDWGDVVMVSSTVGNNTGRLCLGAPDYMRPSDIGCPTYAPSITTSGDVSVTGNLSANAFIGDGSGLTGLASGDRITSSTLNVIANGATGYVSLSTAVSTWGYLNDTLSYLPALWSTRVSATNISGTTAHFAGYVGIGTSSPLYRLEVTTAGVGGNAIGVSTTLASWGLVMTPNGVGYSGLYHTAAGNGQLYLRDAIGTTGVLLDASGTSYLNGGNVGIGTTSPQATLQVSGSLIVSTSAQTTTPSLYVGTDGRVGIGTSAPGSLFEVSGSTGGWQFNSTGDVLVFLENGWNYLSATKPSGRLVFQTGGTNHRMIIDPSGNVGIGTTAPSTTLTVSGSVLTTSWTGINMTRLAVAPLEVSGTISATALQVNGVAITGSASPAGVSGSIQFNNGSNALAGRSNIVVDDTGQVAIGTTAPSATLDVSGTMKLAGGTGAETCDTDHYGTFRRNPTTGAIQICVQR